MEGNALFDLVAAAFSGLSLLVAFLSYKASRAKEAASKITELQKSLGKVVSAYARLDKEVAVLRAIVAGDQGSLARLERKLDEINRELE